VTFDLCLRVKIWNIYSQFSRFAQVIARLNKLLHSSLSLTAPEPAVSCE